MTFNSLTLEASCEKCSYQWRARTAADPPKKCPKCGSLAWLSGNRKFSALLVRSNGRNQENGLMEFCILPELTDSYAITDDVFYISEEDIKLYLPRARTPKGSACLFYGDVEIGEDKMLNFKDLKLVYVHEAFMRSYGSLSLVYKKSQNPYKGTYNGREH